MSICFWNSRGFASPLGSGRSLALLGRCTLNTVATKPLPCGDGEGFGDGGGVGEGDGLLLEYGDGAGFVGEGNGLLLEYGDGVGNTGFLGNTLDVFLGGERGVFGEV